MGLGTEDTSLSKRAYGHKLHIMIYYLLCSQGNLQKVEVDPLQIGPALNAHLVECVGTWQCDNLVRGILVMVYFLQHSCSMSAVYLHLASNKQTCIYICVFCFLFMEGICDSQHESFSLLHKNVAFLHVAICNGIWHCCLPIPGKIAM